MKQYRYQLERYKGKSTKHRCPGCNSRTFTRYIDTETGEYVAEDVGRCDREDRCGEHRKPKEHFAENDQHKDEKSFTVPYSRQEYRQVPKQQEQQPTEPGNPLNEMFERSLQPCKTVEVLAAENSFIKYLLTLFPVEIAAELISRYYIGTSSGHWHGATVFWFKSATGQVKAGQVKLFDETGHTASYTSYNGERKKCNNWIHSILSASLKKAGQPLPDWLQAYNDQDEKVSCLYGEHLLNRPENSSKTVALCESPKTAIIASIYFPKFVWLACGSLSYLTLSRCQALKGRKVCLFPDLSKDGTAYAKWSLKVKQLSGIARFNVYDLLERKATVEERAAGLDLADFLARYDYRQFTNEPLQEAIPVQQAQQLSKEIHISEDELKLYPNVWAICCIREGYCILTFETLNGQFVDVLFDGPDGNTLAEKLEKDKDFVSGMFCEVKAWIKYINLNKIN